jgi:predicted transglutaminase-like cysteine proteinase
MKQFFYTLIIALGMISPASAAVFGRAGQVSSDISAFHKWQRVKMQAQQVSAQLWQGFLPPTQIAKAGGLQRLQWVNQRVNSRLRYMTDEIAWKQADYWASPAETLARGLGDCDDFAIVKYYLLLKLGVPAETMQIVVLNDTQQNILHAVLAVEQDGAHYILDNRFAGIYQDRAMPQYRPIFAVTQNRWWRYS